MIKLIWIAILIGIAAYCSYQIAVTIQWQKMLRCKQEMFGVSYEGAASASVLYMKQLRAICVACAVFSILVPSRYFPFSQPKNQEASMLAKEGPVIDDRADQSEKLGIMGETVPAETTATYRSLTSAEPAETDKTDDFAAQWKMIQSDLSAISAIVIESYDTAEEALSEARAKSLLTKDLVLADLPWDQEDYVLKIQYKGAWYRLRIRQEDNVFYVLDEQSEKVYQLK